MAKKRHLSRREMLRRIDQGKLAMRALAAAVVDAGGTLIVKRDTFDNLPLEHRFESSRDTLTGDIILRVLTTEHLAQENRRPANMAELREKYGQASSPAEVASVSGEVRLDDQSGRASVQGEANPPARIRD